VALVTTKAIADGVVIIAAMAAEAVMAAMVVVAVVAVMAVVVVVAFRAALPPVDALPLRLLSLMWL
jgi:hypothetical protein